MKKEYLIGGIIIVALALYLWPSGGSLGGIVKAPSYTTASSTAFTVANAASVEVLGSRGGRGYASLCNTAANKVYLNFGSATITATNSADVLIVANSCYTINSENLFTGPVTAIQETASPTNSFLVTEFIGS